jgi:hypothetical protein
MTSNLDFLDFLSFRNRDSNEVRIIPFVQKLLDFAEFLDKIGPDWLAVDKCHGGMLGEHQPLAT